MPRANASRRRAASALLAALTLLSPADAQSNSDWDAYSFLAASFDGTCTAAAGAPAIACSLNLTAAKDGAA